MLSERVVRLRTLDGLGAALQERGVYMVSELARLAS